MVMTSGRDLDTSVGQVSVLDPDGNPVPGGPYPSELQADDHRSMLTAMVVTRRLDREFVNLQRQGQLALFPSCLGQEAAQVGTTSALRDDDWLVPQYRELGAFVVRGVPPEGLGHMWRGTCHGGFGMVERNVAPHSIPIGTHALHAVGLAMGAQRDEDGSIAVAFIGDGATSEGDVHEAFNMAAVFEAPCIFVVQNNQWAISVPFINQTRSATIAKKADAYGMPGVRCDGNDVLACWSVMREAATRARDGLGPTLIEAVTYRMGAHTTSDDPTRYRDEAELEQWRMLDPIIRYEHHLRAQGIWSDDDAAVVERRSEEAAQSLRDAVFDAPAPNPLGVFDHVLSSLTPELEEQRRQLAAELS
jgi:pyruvate dehydrogenase E1 component alpha subunit